MNQTVYNLQILLTRTSKTKYLNNKWKISWLFSEYSEKQSGKLITKWPICLMKINRPHTEVHGPKRRECQIHVRQLTKFKNIIMLSCSDYQAVLPQHNDINHSFFAPYTTTQSLPWMPENLLTFAAQYLQNTTTTTRRKSVQILLIITFQNTHIYFFLRSCDHSS